MAFLKEYRTSDTSFDIIKIGMTPGENKTKGSQIVTPYAVAGATWWLESLFTKRNFLEQMRQRIRQGPPKG